MDVIEKAIRNALEKGDATDRVYRENVYRSAFSALEKALKANPSTTVESAIKRRRTLQTTITDIERHFLVPTVPEPQADYVANDHLDAAPDADLRFAPANNPKHGKAKKRPAPRKKKQRSSALASLFTTVLLAVLVGGGFWWAVSSGLLGVNTVSFSSGSSGNASSAGPRTISEAQSLEDWAVIFTPSDADAVAAGSNGIARAMQDESGRFLRIAPTTANSTLTFPITQSVLSEVGGARAMFNIIARSSDGTPTQIAVECDFGSMGNCGRTRYEIPALRGENLFEVDLSQGTASNGAIRVDANVQNDGKSIDIYEIRAIRQSAQ